MATTNLSPVVFPYDVAMVGSLVVSTLPVGSSSEVRCPHMKTTVSLQSGHARPSTDDVHTLMAHPTYVPHFILVPNGHPFFFIKFLTPSAGDLSLFIPKVSSQWKPYFGINY